jgi:hypothetical protein
MLTLPRRFVPVILMASAGWSIAHFGAAPSPQDPVLSGSTSHTIFAAYDTLGPDWRTTLLLNNSTRVPITVNPKAYSQDGAGAPLPTIRLEAHEHKRMDFDQLIAPLGNQFAQGSLQLEYLGAPMGVGAILSTMNQSHSLVVEALLHGQMDFKSSELEAIWRAPDRDARMTLSLTNIGEQSLNASVSLSAQDGTEIRRQIVPLAAHQTRILNLRELIARDDLLGGISVRYDQTVPGAVLAQGFVIQPDTGFSYDLPFVDPATLGDTRFSGAGIPLGVMGGGNQPAYNMSGRLLLRNLSTAPLNVSPTLQRGAIQAALPQVVLQPGESKDVTVSPSSAPGGNEPLGIELRYTGLQGQAVQPGQLVAQWFSSDDSGNMVVEVPLRSLGPKERLNGSNPFLLADDYSSVTYIKNIGDKASHVLAYIDHAGGNYMIGLKEIKPGETLAIDIRKLRDDQVKDENGQTLPTDLLTGHINWRIHDGAQIVGRTSVMSLSQAIAENRSCGGCTCSPIDVQFSMSAFTDQGDGTATTSIQETDTSCDGWPRSFSIPNEAFSWSTKDPNGNDGSYIAEVDVHGKVTYQGPGTATITATTFPDICHCVHFGVEDGCDCELVDPPQSRGGSQQVTSPIVLRIRFGGNDITGTTQSVVEGQQIALTTSITLPSGVTVQSQSWSVPGTSDNPPAVVADFSHASTNGGAVALTNLSQSSTTFYWVTAGNSKQVTFTLHLSNGSTPSAKATFNVAGPTSPNVHTCGGNVTTCASDGTLGQVAINPGPFLQFGGTQSNVGIIFAASATPPSGYSNNFTWIQYIRGDLVDLTPSNGDPVKHCVPTTQPDPTTGIGLDTQFPYATASPTNDNPKLGLTPTYKEVQRNFSATMYLMWRPGLPNDLLIPLGWVEWQFLGDALLTGASTNQWSLSPTSGSGSSGQFQPSSFYPVWSSFVPYNGTVTCH